MNNVLMGYDENVAWVSRFTFVTQIWSFNKIVKPFVGTVILVPELCSKCLCHDRRRQRPLTDVVCSILYGGTVTVPQSCEINAGQTILVNFGIAAAISAIRAKSPEGVRAKNSAYYR